MEPFRIPATKGTPEIIIDPSDLRMSVRGMSIPENAAEFYTPVIQALDNVLLMRPASFEARIDLTYFNSSSLKALYMLLLRLKEARTMGTDLRVVWVVEGDDEFMLESSMYFRDLLGIELQLEHIADRDDRERKAS